MPESNNQLQLRVVTPEGIALDKSVTSVVLWTAMGEIQVFPGHTPIVVMLEPGELRAYDGKGRESLFAAGEGFAEINGGSVTVLSDLAEDAGQISIQVAEEAKHRAETALADAAKLSDEERQAADLALREALVKIRVSLRKKHPDHPAGFPGA